MATNYEQIQADLAACNITIWEPDALSTVQLSICRLGCMIAEIANLAARVTAAADALTDIETIATLDSGVDDVKFSLSSGAQGAVWSMIPTISGSIEFSVNTNSDFYKTFLIPAVSALLVPLTTDDGAGGQIDKTEVALLAERTAALRNNPVNVVETTIPALTAFSNILTAKKTQLEATYA